MPLSRRSLLALTTSLAGVAGCLGGDAETTPTETEPASPTVSATPAPTESPTATETPTPPPLVYPFYVVNRGETARCVRVSVRAGDSPAAVSGTYRVEAGDVIQFTDATTVGTRYTVEVSLSDGRSLSREWTPEQCLDYAGGREASKAGFVSFDADSLFFAENGCDAVSRTLQHPNRVDPEPDDCSV